MPSLPPIDYSPLTKGFVPIAKVSKILAIKDSWLPDSEYYGNHQPFSLSQAELAYAAKLYTFAEKNNFELIGNFPGLPFPKSYFHSFATLNFQVMITYGVIMQLKEGWLEIGQLRLATASQFTPNDTYLTYMKVTLGQNLPDLTIDSRSEGLPTRSIGRISYTTESNEFNRLFKLYFGKDHVQQGLKVLSPDVMSILIDYFDDFDIEMRGNIISLITRGCDLTDPDTLKNLLETTTALVGELSYQVRSPAAAGAIPEDIASYKAAHRYVRESEAVIRAKARKETLRTFLYSLLITFFLFLLLFTIAALGML